MKRIALSLLILFSSLYGSARSLHVRTRGHVMGQLSEIRVAGDIRSVVQGEILLGRESGASDERLKGRGSARSEAFVNPWKFCAANEFYETIKELVGEYVVVEYQTPKHVGLIQCRASHELLDVYPVNRGYLEEASMADINLPVASGAGGIRVGRVVDAVVSGRHSQDRFVTIQVGNSGDEFDHLEVAEEGLFSFAVKSLKSGQRVRAFYVERFAFIGGKNNRQRYLWKLETVNDL